MSQTQTITAVSLEEIIKIENLENREFLARPILSNTWEELYNAEIMYMGTAGDVVYTGSQRFSHIDVPREMRIDSGGLPYIFIPLGSSESFVVYSDEFLGHKGFADSAAGNHSKALLEIRDKLMKTEHPVYKQFLDYAKDAIDKAPSILEAIRQFQSGDSSRLKSFSALDLKIFEHLAQKRARWRPHHGPYEPYDPDSYDITNINLSDRDNVDLVNITKEESAFIEWYKSYMISKGYREKAEDLLPYLSGAIKRHIALTAKRLEDHGFKRVEQFSYRAS